jgi:hypothetical protein
MKTTRPSSPSAPANTSKSVSDLRRGIGRTSLRRFAEVYLHHYFKEEPGVMHAELFEMLETATAKRGTRLAIAAPRGHAKSTIVSLAYILWCVCYGFEDYIVLISNTADQANDALSHLKKELEDNALLLQDFPGMLPGAKARPAPVAEGRDHHPQRGQDQRPGRRQQDPREKAPPQPPGPDRARRCRERGGCSVPRPADPALGMVQ